MKTQNMQMQLMHIVNYTKKYHDIRLAYELYELWRKSLVFSFLFMTISTGPETFQKLEKNP